MISPRFIARILLFACSIIFVSSAAIGQETTKKVRFETIAKNLASGHSERKNYVITNKDEWESVWTLAMSNTYPSPRAPEIDFSTKSVIAVFQGFEPSDGYSVSIAKVVRSGNTIKVTIRESLPDDSCKVLLVVTQPFHIIEIDKVDEATDVAFKIKRDVRYCQ